MNTGVKICVTVEVKKDILRVKIMKGSPGIKCNVLLDGGYSKVRSL